MTSAFDNPNDMMTGANNVGEGWHPLIRELEGKLNELGPEFEILEVREKFGGLLYSAAIDTEDKATYQKFRKVIKLARGRSTSICEACGQPGLTQSIQGWLKTLCDEHPAERLAGLEAR